LNRVGGEVHDANVVTVDKGAPRRQALELMEQLPQPSGLSHTVGDDTVLSLRAGMRDGNLSFGRPRHQVDPRNTAWPDAERRVSGQPAQSTSV
jgi:hypothetical protein